ncbi:MAG: hypothetical protein JHC93_06010 [Parachlamydiales bacterium]|nr:hypothetical protein [Parachlamydiales bacterium]
MVNCRCCNSHLRTKAQIIALFIIVSGIILLLATCVEIVFNNKKSHQVYKLLGSGLVLCFAGCLGFIGSSLQISRFIPIRSVFIPALPPFVNLFHPREVEWIFPRIDP